MPSGRRINDETLRGSLRVISSVGNVFVTSTSENIIQDVLTITN